MSKISWICIYIYRHIHIQDILNTFRHLSILSTSFNCTHMSTARACENVFIQENMENTQFRIFRTWPQTLTVCLCLIIAAWMGRGNHVATRIFTTRIFTTRIYQVWTLSQKSTVIIRKPSFSNGPKSLLVRYVTYICFNKFQLLCNVLVPASESHKVK